MPNLVVTKAEKIALIQITSLISMGIWLTLNPYNPVVSDVYCIYDAEDSYAEQVEKAANYYRKLKIAAVNSFNVNLEIFEHIANALDKETSILEKMRKCKQQIISLKIAKKTNKNLPGLDKIKQKLCAQRAEFNRIRTNLKEKIFKEIYLYVEKDMRAIIQAISKNVIALRSANSSRAVNSASKTISFSDVCVYSVEDGAVSECNNKPDALQIQLGIEQKSRIIEGKIKLLQTKISKEKFYVLTYAFVDELTELESDIAKVQSSFIDFNDMNIWLRHKKTLEQLGLSLNELRVFRAEALEKDKIERRNHALPMFAAQKRKQEVTAIEDGAVSECNNKPDALQIQLGIEQKSRIIEGKIKLLQTKISKEKFYVLTYAFVDELTELESDIAKVQSSFIDFNDMNIWLRHKKTLEQLGLSLNELRVFRAEALEKDKIERRNHALPIFAAQKRKQEVTAIGSDLLMPKVTKRF